MKLLDATLPTPAENLACDEALLDLCEEAGVEVLRFWESREHFVVVGYGNRIEREVSVAQCRQRGIPILRRCSGGGTVVQGPGCLNYNITLRIPDEGALATVTGANRFIMEKNRAALAELLGVGVTVQGHTDLAFAEVEDAAPRGWFKLSGNAHRRRRHSLVFHGTILYDFDLTLIHALLPLPSVQPDYRASRTHADFLRNISAKPAMIRSALLAEWAAKEIRTEAPQDRIQQLLREHY